MGIDLKKISMKKLSIIVSIVAFSILVVALVIILNFTKPQKSRDVMKDVTKVGLLLLGEHDDRSWNQTHAEALSRISEELNLEVLTVENAPTDELCDDVIRKLIDEDDCKVIIGTSFEYAEHIEKAADAYPGIYFLSASGTAVRSNMSSFFGRMYQLRYLSGIIAGNQTKTGHIGYVAPFPIPEVNRDLNAFTLGVRSINPDAVVYVSFCDSWTDDNAAQLCTKKLITEHDADVIAMQVDSLAPMRTAEEMGVWTIGNNADNSDLFPDSFLTACEWHWDDYYYKQILLCKQGKFTGTLEWLGMDSGIMQLTPPERSGNVITGYKTQLDHVQKLFRDRSYDVFYGPVTDNSGNIRVAEGESMSDETMLNSFDWYVEGVETVN